MFMTNCELMNDRIDKLKGNQASIFNVVAQSGNYGITCAEAMQECHLPRHIVAARLSELRWQKYLVTVKRHPGGAPLQRRNFNTGRNQCVYVMRKQ